MEKSCLLVMERDAEESLEHCDYRIKLKQQAGKLRPEILRHTGPYNSDLKYCAIQGLITQT